MVKQQAGKLWLRLRWDASREKRLKKNHAFGLEMLEARQLLAANPVITELMASNNNALADGDGNSSDWIEVLNAGDAAVDLAGYHLTDDAKDLDQWTFPSIALDPGDYLVVFASGQDAGDFVDAGGNLHTNFRLAAGGDYLALVSPQGEILSEFGSGDTNYPPQVTDVSYGFSQAVTLIHADSPSTYWLPLDARVDSTWMQPDFDAAANGFSEGTASLGFETKPNDRTNFTNLIKTPLRDGSLGVYTRMEFGLADAADVSALKLRLKYDNGFIAYLNGVKVAEDNAPARPGWFSTAPNNAPRDSRAIEFTDFDLTDRVGQLRSGSNVLAIHGMNHLRDASDMLLVAELIADQPLDQAPVGYLPTATPGGPNFSLDAITGPLISEVTDAIDGLGDNQDLLVTARLAPVNAPVQSASLEYRVMFDNEVAVPMVDDGTGPDATAGDGVYSAVIPNTASNPGDMVRWRVAALDTEGNRSRAPLGLIPDPKAVRQMSEYFGTVVADPSLEGQLPVFQWFAENERSGHNRNGTRASVFYGGEFYDNVFARQRGGATNASVSQKFVFNRDHEFLVNDKLGRVRELNMNGPGSDQSYVRQTLAYQAYTAAGNGSCESFLVNMQVNGDFDRVGIFIEQVDKNFIERQGLDPNGPLYKFVQRGNLGPVFSDTVTGIEKKTQITKDIKPLTLPNGQTVTTVEDARRQDVSDVQTIVDGLSLPTAEEKKQFLFDNFDISQITNYLALRSVTMDADDVRKNFYLYRDTSGTGLWTIYPWDKDWTFGVEGDGAPHLRNPFFGDQEHAKANANQWNMLYDVLFDEPATREMFLRRLRSVMDEFLGPPGTPAGESYYEQRANEIFAAAEPLLPRSAASNFQSMMRSERGYFDRRRTDLYVNHSIHNPDFRGNAGIPDAQVGNPAITFGQIEFDPASGNQDEEFIELANPNSVAVDISGWKLTDGIEFTFPAGTVIPAGGSLYVSPNVSVFRARTGGPTSGQGLFIVGDYAGHLSRDGETVSLLAKDGSVVRRVSVGGTPSPVEQALRISELNYQPHGPIAAWGEADDGTPTAADRFEYVELTNTGDQPLDLSGAVFTAGIDFTFPSGTTLDPGSFILVVKDQAAFESRYGTGRNIAGQFAGELDDGGESVFLDSASGRAIQSFAYRADAPWPARAEGRGSSLEAIDPAGNSDSPDNWRASIDFGGSPGRAAADVRDPVEISEVLTHGSSPRGDMIELHNTSGGPVDISNWYLSHLDDDYFQFRIPAGMTIAGGGYQVLDQTQFGFDLDRARGDQVRLISADAGGRPLRFVDRVAFGPSALDVSLGPWPTTGDPWIMLAKPTFGGPNTGPYVGDVAISELHYAPADPDGRGRLKADNFEFIELYNRTDTAVDIGGWQLTGDVQYVFPAGTVVGPKEARVVVGFEPTDAAPANVFKFTLGLNPAAQLLGPYAPALSDQGGAIQLIRPDAPPADDPALIPWLLMDRIIYSASSPWPSDIVGSGQSLVRTGPTEFGELPTSWTAAAAPSPGTAEFTSRVIGDANEDGQFDQRDLVQVLAAGKFMTGQPASWAEGDWTGDGRFDQQDLVALLQTGAGRGLASLAARGAEADAVDALFAEL